METITIVINTEQSCSISYYLTREELLDLKDLILNGGEAIISGRYLKAEGDYLTEYKKNDFQGPNYAMPVDRTVLDMIDEKLLESR